MKILLSLSLLCSLSQQLLQEAQEWGGERLMEVCQENWETMFAKEDVLPEQDKGKEFRAENDGTQEIRGFLGTSPKKQRFDGDEDFLHESRDVLEDPEKEIGIISTRTQIIPEEEQRVVCEEVGTYQVSFLQKRVVEAIPPIKNQNKKCSGHMTLSECFFWKSGAEEEMKRIKKSLSQDSTIKTFTVQLVDVGGVKNHKVFSHWEHKDNMSNCGSYVVEEILVQQGGEKDVWETDFPTELSVVEGNPYCRLLYSQIVEGPGMHMVGSQSIFRDVWGRHLFFSCEPLADSPCAKLRERGGVLIKKRCLKDNIFGECDLWEKTYDLGKKASRREDTQIFDGQEIFGLSGVFDTSYDKNQEIASVVSALSIFADLKQELENSGRDFSKDIPIFQGEAMRCQCSFIHGALYDCCKKMDGLAVSVYLARCNAEEQALAERRHAGQCHHVGSHKENFQTSQVFCCFPTKLARILHEQGRAQLGISWGDSSSPECHGFSLSELQQVDFTKIDLSDAIEDLSIDKQELLQKVRATIDRLQSGGQIEGKENTEKMVNVMEQVKNGS